VKDFLHDLRIACRTLLQRPSFTLPALISLALGVGANTTIFSLVHAAFLARIPVHDPDRVVAVTVGERGHAGLLPTSLPNFRDYRDQNDVVSGLAAVQWFRPNWQHGDEPERLMAQVVSDGFFPVMGVEAVVGRTFRPEDFAGSGQGLVAVVTYNFWHRNGGEPSFVGSRLSLNGRPVTVVGVTPRGFKGSNVFNEPDLFMPLSCYPLMLPSPEHLEDRGWALFEMLGRLEPGVSRPQARAAFQTIAHRLEARYPESNKNLVVDVLPLADAAIDPQQKQVYSRSAILLMAVVSLLLLIACANVASLLLSRGIARRREAAICLALGARRWHLVRRLLAESLVLALGGGACGALLAVWGPGLLWRFRPPFFTEKAFDLGLNSEVLIYTLLISVGSGVCFGLAPALQTCRADLVTPLKQQGGGASGKRRLPMGNLLIVAQVALSVIALIGAGLFLHSLRNAQRIDPGFNTRNILTMNLFLSGRSYGEARGRLFYRRVVEVAARLPGIEAASLASNRPLHRGALYRRAIPEGGTVSSRDEIPPVRTNTVGAGYFKTLQIRMLSGRDFDDHDRPDTPLVGIVNQVLARRFWPGQDPVGRRILVPDDKMQIEVIGVAANSKYMTLGEPPTPMLYMSLGQLYLPEIDLYVRTAGPTERLREPLRRAIQATDRALPIANYESMQEAIDVSLWGPRMGAVLLSLFGALALTLAATGIYGVVSYSVSQRHREVGIRMALGARRASVLRMILSQTMIVVGSGLAVGLPLASFGSRSLAGMLYGISGSDPGTFAEIALLLALVALAASFLAARRGTHIDPALVMRDQ
jgi:predicted permease